MKNAIKILFVVVLLNIVANAKAATKVTNPSSENNTDTTLGLKSNIVIFKIITTPLPTNNSQNGSLKKAGKVARTSSHTSSSIDTFVFRKKGI